ncbi:MAG: glycosyltransferase family 4 protein [Firmicutes bacterium]|nr:glycosyltransferase family 4 protein [Bacillota bacterium]
MRVLFLMLNYPFDKKREHMYKDLSKEFAKMGHDVYVAALLERRFGNNTFVEKEKKHTILWIKGGNYFGVNKIKKGLTAIALPFIFSKAINKNLARVNFDLIIYPTPAITLYFTVKRLKRLLRAKTLLIVKDIFPQNALDIGMLNKGLVYKVFRNIEKKLYHISDFLGCMSEGNIEYLKQHNSIPSSKFFILENWSSTIDRAQLTADERVAIKKRYNVSGKFVCVFGGNISPANELDFLLDLAQKVQEDGLDDMVFLVIGKGIGKERLKQKIKSLKLTNVKMFNFIPTEEYDKLLQTSDLGLVNLSRAYTIPNIPSKTLNLLRLGLPILAATDKNTDYRELLNEEFKAGLWCETGDINKYYENLLELYKSEEKRNQFSKNGRRYFVNNLTTEVAYQKIVQKIGENLDE